MENQTRIEWFSTSIESEEESRGREEERVSPKHIKRSLLEQYDPMSWEPKSQEGAKRESSEEEN